MRILSMLLILFLAGCSAAVRTPMFDARVKTGSNFLGINSGVGVVFPYQSAAYNDTLPNRFGPAWENVQGYYPEYKFN